VTKESNLKLFFFSRENLKSKAIFAFFAKTVFANICKNWRIYSFPFLLICWRLYILFVGCTVSVGGSCSSYSMSVFKCWRGWLSGSRCRWLLLVPGCRVSAVDCQRRLLLTFFIVGAQLCLLGCLQAYMTVKLVHNVHAFLQKKVTIEKGIVKIRL
jgi:hypothetical protein